MDSLNNTSVIKLLNEAEEATDEAKNGLLVLEDFIDIIRRLSAVTRSLLTECEQSRRRQTYTRPAAASSYGAFESPFPSEENQNQLQLTSRDVDRLEGRDGGRRDEILNIVAHLAETAPSADSAVFIG
jgi:hypothetical protein